MTAPARAVLRVRCSTIRLDARANVCDPARRLPIRQAPSRRTASSRPPDTTPKSNPDTTKPAPAQEPKQLLHLVFGGELTDLDSVTFRDLSKLDVVGIFPDYASAAMAWKAKAQQTVDSAQTRYFIVHLHRLLQP